MSEPIAEQLAELAMFKVLINQVLRDTGQPALDTDFNAYYQTVRSAILDKGPDAIIEDISGSFKNTKVETEENVLEGFVSQITEIVSLTKQE